MSDTKLRLEDLTSEERAIVDNAALFYRRVTGAVGETAEWAYVEALKEAEPIILARRAIFGEGEAAKLECPNCGQEVARHREHVGFSESNSAWQFLCQPAPPEPAATVDTTKTVAYCDELDARYGKPAAREMESARGAIAAAREYALELDHPESMEFHIRVDGFATGARYQRNLAQPVAVGMTEELEHVLSIAERDLRYKEECFDNSARTVHDERIERLRAAIAAVREQFGKRPKLEKVRGALSWLKMQYEPGSQGYTPNATVWKMTEAALAELDAAEGKRRE